MSPPTPGPFPALGLDLFNCTTSIVSAAAENVDHIKNEHVAGPLHVSLII